MEKLVQDLRFALRSLVRRPGFALTAIVTLALGIGSTTAIFSVVERRDPPAAAVRARRSHRRGRGTCGRRPGCARRPSRRRTSTTGRRRAGASRRWRTTRGGETSVTHGRRAPTTLRVPGHARVLRGARRARGHRAAAVGRGTEAGRAGGRRDHRRLLARRFNADPKAIGATVKFDDRVFTIVGVLEPRHPVPARAPTSTCPAGSVRRRRPDPAHNYRVIARLQRRRVRSTRRVRK